MSYVSRIKQVSGLSGAMLLGTLAASNTALAVDCGPDNIIEHKKPALHFNPIPMENPETGEEYHPNDILEMDDGSGGVTRIKASEYFAEVNELEEKLNLWGYSVRDGDEVTLSSINYCVPRLKEQAKLIDEFVRDQDMEFLMSPGEWDEKWLEAWNQYKEEIPSWDDLYRYADDDEYDVYMPEVPVFNASKPVFERKPIEFTKEKTYNLYEGNDGSFSVGIYPYYKIGATKVEVRGEAGVNVEGAILGRWKGSVAEIALKANSPGSGPLTLDLVASVLDGKKTWNEPLVKEGALRYEDSVRSAVAQSVDYRFAIGPIPCKGEVGLRGEAGFQWGIELYPLQVGAFTGPWAAADVYAQVGADIKVAGIGVGGQLLLAAYQLTLQGSGEFEWDEEPLINLSMALVSDLELLSGKLYAYAYIKLLWKKLKKKHTFFKWKGYKKKGSLFDYTATLTRNGLVAKGDLSAEDVLEMNHVNREAYVQELEEKAVKDVYETMKAVVEDIASKENREIAIEAAKVHRLMEALIERQETYWKHLNSAMEG